MLKSTIFVKSRIVFTLLLLKSNETGNRFVTTFFNFFVVMIVLAHFLKPTQNGTHPGFQRAIFFVTIHGWILISVFLPDTQGRITVKKRPGAWGSPERIPRLRAVEWNLKII